MGFLKMWFNERTGWPAVTKEDFDSFTTYDLSKKHRSGGGFFSHEYEDRLCAYPTGNGQYEIHHEEFRDVYTDLRFCTDWIARGPFTAAEAIDILEKVEAVYTAPEKNPLYHVGKFKALLGQEYTPSSYKDMDRKEVVTMLLEESISPNHDNFFVGKASSYLQEWEKSYYFDWWPEPGKQMEGQAQHP